MYDTWPPRAQHPLERSRVAHVDLPSYHAIHMCGHGCPAEEDASRLMRLDIEAIMFNAYILVVIDAPVVLRMVECLMSLIETRGFGLASCPSPRGRSRPRPWQFRHNLS